MSPYEAIPPHRRNRLRHQDSWCILQGWGRRFRLPACPTMKPALVTGASGFLGWHVARVLLERGYRVRALVRPGSRVDDLDVEPVTGDLRDPASLERAVAGCGLVFHVAADYRLWAKDPGELYRSNVEGTRNMLAGGAGRPGWSASSTPAPSAASACRRRHRR